MITQTVKFVDFDGKEETVELSFHLSKTALLELWASRKDYSQYLLSVVDNAKENPGELISTLKDILDRAYGEREGRYFRQSPEISALFRQSPEYDAFFMSLISDSKKAGAFFTSILPLDKNNPEHQAILRDLAAVAEEEEETVELPGDPTVIAQNVFTNPENQVPEETQPSLEQMVQEMRATPEELQRLIEIVSGQHEDSNKPTNGF